MSDLRKAAEMSIEAIMDGDVKDKAAAVYALRQALAQPKREWVGLTDEEKAWCGAPTLQETVARVEAKLKEKNA